MCGISIIADPDLDVGSIRERLRAMNASQSHRGPDDVDVWTSPDGVCGLGHRRLSILGTTAAGRQPMSTTDGRYHIVLNGEIYNYLELADELGGRSSFTTGTDTEVLLRAWQRWGVDCLDRLIGMFGFAVWDEREQRLHVVRDRFGVKPVYLHARPDGGLWVSSEIKAIHAAGLSREPDHATWATYLSFGVYDHTDRTFWRNVESLPPGHRLEWTAENGAQITQWYDLADSVGAVGTDERETKEVGDELLGLLEETIRLRFRSDVPVGICLSGGVDSSLLLGMFRRVFGANSPVTTFTFICDDERYDESPWVRRMLDGSPQSGEFCRLDVDQVASLSERMQRHQDEPFGGFPTLGMAKVYERARELGVTVLLDGNGLDEGWAGYDYYARANEVDASRGPVQGSRSPSTLPGCLRSDFAVLAVRPRFPKPFPDAARCLQYRDARYSKIPRAMRFADRASMSAGRELREPFLDHRIVELGLRQPIERRIHEGRGKWLVREVARRVLPHEVGAAPKRPVQTPQREWLREPLAGWVDSMLNRVFDGWGRDFLDEAKTREAWARYRGGAGDNSFPVWQWVSLGLLSEGCT